MFRTKNTPYFFVADHYGLWNTASLGSKDLASGIPRGKIFSSFRKIAPVTSGSLILE
jgi:hypothetical protein